MPVVVRIQLNCEGPGRVFRIRLKPGDNRLVIDPPFEQLVHSTDYLSLRYGDNNAEHQLRDALKIGKLLAIESVILVTRTESGDVLLRRVNVSLEKLVSTVSLSLDATTDELSAAALALSGNRSGAIAAVAPRGQTTVEHPDDAALLYTGTALVVVGASSLALGWLQYAQRARRRDDFDAAGDFVDLARMEALGVFAVTMTTVGAVATTASLPALLPDSEGIPAAAWMVGAAGAGVAVTGILLWNAGDSCTGADCDPDRIDPTLGVLVTLHAAPLIAVPVTYAIRSMLNTDDVSASAHITATSSGVVVGGRF